MKKQKRVLLSWMLILTMLVGVLPPASALALPDATESTDIPAASVPDTVYKPDTPELAPQTPLAGAAPPIVMASVPSDKTSVLVNANLTFDLTVTQGEPIASGGELDGRSNFTIALKDIKVPTKGDDSTAADEDVILQGDWAIFDRATYFPDTKLAPAAAIPIKETIDGAPLTIGTVQFFVDSVKIVFSGAGVFDGTKANVKVGFIATAIALDETPGQETDTNIFGDSFKFKNAALDAQYNIALRCNTMSGHYSWISAAAFQEGTIGWEAVISATDKTNSTILMDAGGLTFLDELKDVGAYVENSFKVFKVAVVNGKDQAPVEIDGATPNVDADGKITYTLPADFGDNKAVITFKTWIPKEKYYNEYDGTNGGLVSSNTSSHMGVNNTAAVQKGSNAPIPSTPVLTALTPDWIQQYVGLKKSGSDTLITWTIDVNKRNFHRSDAPKSGLKGITIFDKLPAGTEFVSATYSVGGVDKGSIIPTGNATDGYNFTIGDSDSPVQLIIVTKVTTLDGAGMFKNIPKATWTVDSSKSNDQANADGVTAETSITVGSHAFTKNGVWQRATAGIKWTISTNLQFDMGSNITFYDMLIHSDSLDVLDSLDTNDKIDAATIAQIKAQIDTKQLNQKYREGTLSVSTGLSGEVIKLMSNGRHVADLVKVIGYTFDKSEDVSFESVTTNTDNLFRTDGGGRLDNRALLFDGDSHMLSKDAWVGTAVRMLNKEMLYAVMPEYGVPSWRRKSTEMGQRPALNEKNWYMRQGSGDGNARMGYDHKDKTVTFRLVVNHAAHNTEEIRKDGRIASEIKLVDTLPVGWEFVEYAPGKDFALFQGYTANGVDHGGYNWVRADTEILPGTENHVVSFSKDKNVGTFSFSELKGTYVILVKARPTNEKLTDYQLGDNLEINNAEFSMKWDGERYNATAQINVVVPLKALSKMAEKPVNGVQKWTINYTPPFEVKQGAYLMDTLAPGFQLRKDLDGNISFLESDLAVYPGSLKSDGTLEKGGAALNLADPDCEVTATMGKDEATGGSTLRFDFENPNKNYLIVYQTGSEGMALGMAGNSVKLMDDPKHTDIKADSFIEITANDVAGSAETNAVLNIKKVGPDGTTPLKDVKFKITNLDGSPVKDRSSNDIGEKTTDSNGLTSFIIPYAGEYLLTQTYIDPLTYLPTTHVYRVRVVNSGGKPVTVDGQKVDSNNPLIVPTPATGKLTVSNTVTGNGGEPNKEFEYTFTLEGEGANEKYNYKIFNSEKVETDSGTITSGGTFDLKDGFTFVIEKLLAGLKYVITQLGYGNDGYTTDPAGLQQEGSVVQNGDHKADFVNTRILVGNLLIGNTVTGNSGDQSKEFEYTIAFTGEDTNETYSYTKSDGTSGVIKSGDTISLMHGQTATIKDILKDTGYTVIEKDYTSEAAGGYTTDPTSRTFTGTIVEKQTAEARFINEKWLPGSLLIENTVTGSGGDKDKDFTYTITFSDGKTYVFTKTTKSGSNSFGNIASGDPVTLKDGEKIVINGIPKDVTYTVTQSDYTVDGYKTTTPVGTLEYYGTIMSNVQAQAPFINHRQLPGTLELKTKPADDLNDPKDIAKVPGDGKHPAKLIATLVDDTGKPVEGATIEFKDKDGKVVGTAITDKDGRAEVPYQPPKVVNTVEEEHPFTATTTAKSPSGVPYEESNQIDVIATPAALFGILRDNKTGEAIPNAEITVTNVDTNERVTIKTNENGEYRHPVNRDEEYTITYNKTIDIGGVPTSVPFTQKADTNDSEITEGKDIPADITAVGIILFKQVDGTKVLMDNTVVSKTHVYLKDGHGEYVKDSSGNPKAFTMGPSGTFSAEGLSEQEYTMEVRYQYEPGKELILTTGKIDVKADGELNITEELVDPYGTVYDETTGNEITGKKIEGAKVTLYYANTLRNIVKGITPGDKVHLPPIPGFAPNGNKSPEQDSDPNGFYAFMVFPEADYYLVVTKTGYETHTSPTISVGIEIVKYDVPMKPVSSSGGNSGGSGGSSGGSQPPEEGSGKPFPPQIPVKPEPKPEPPKQPEVTPKPEEPKKPAENPEEPKKPEATPKQPMLKERTLENTPIGGRVTVPERSTTEVEQPTVSGSNTVKELPVNSTVSVKQPPANGTATVKDDGTWEYTPAPGFIGKDQFTITIKYPDGTEEDILIEIEVGEVPLGSTLPSGVTQLPKTGEINPFVHYVFGFAMIVIGAVLLRRSKALRGKLHS